MNRRKFLQQTSALSAASLFCLSEEAFAEPAPEVKRIRLINSPAVCLAFAYLAEELLHAEGFEEVLYVDLPVNTSLEFIASGKVDIWVDPAPALANALASIESIVALGGVHAGCYELLAQHGVQQIRDLKGRSVAVSTLGAVEHIFVASISSYIGLNPRQDIEWKVGGSMERAMKLFSDGEADAYLAFAPQPQILRSRKIGHTILNTTQDQPWSQYFCCMLTGNREFVRKNPIATKRAMRAFLKAADICASDPQRAARFMVDKGYVANYDVALEVLSELPYRRWRDGNPEDTIRFHALRLHEAGIIQTQPQKLIERGTDWRFLNELKKELKA